MDIHKEEINKRKKLILHFIENEVLSCLGFYLILIQEKALEIACMAWHNEKGNA